MSLPYPPPYQDIHALAEHLSCSTHTIENWVKQGVLPAPRIIGGKRLWKWKEVEKRLAPQDNTGAPSPVNQGESITNAVRATTARNH